MINKIALVLLLVNNMLYCMQGITNAPVAYVMHRTTNLKNLSGRQQVMLGTSATCLTAGIGCLSTGFTLLISKGFFAYSLIPPACALPVTLGLLLSSMIVIPVSAVGCSEFSDHTSPWCGDARLEGTSNP